MAGAILTFLLKSLSNSLSLGASSSSSTEPPSSSEQELQKLERTMKRIHALLEDAEEREVTAKSEQLRLRELKEVAYDAEDAVDEYQYDVLHAKVEARRRATATQMGDKHDKVIFDLNSYQPKVSISDELADRVKDIRKRFEEITDDWNRLLDKVGKRRCIRKWKPMETTSFFDRTRTFGREDEKNRIITWLLQEEDVSSGDSTVSILPIVGMGGLGKTTLAQMAYNDTRVEKCFNLRGWVHVSEEFDVASLVKRICNSFCMNISHIDELKSIVPLSLDDLHWKLKVMLDGKKFFLVLDDVWNENIELWSSLKTFLVGIGRGKILVTTRNEPVAKIMQTTPAMKLGHLSFDDSWLLFKKIAYEGMDHNYSEIGQKIVSKCQGLPLAIKVLAGILRLEDEKEAWVEILESELWKLDGKRDNIFPILKLSYDHLPIELKQCFVYLSLFPKGSFLDRSTIIQQWMSHGFIQTKGKKLEEDVGNDYFNEFLHRSILQYYYTNSPNGGLRMHDLIHDLAQYVAEDEYLLLTNLKSHGMLPKTIRHISIHIENEFEIIHLEPLREAKHLRTLVLNVHRGGITNITDLLAELTCLRTLVLTKWEPAELPDSIGRLKHLRYLQISFPEEQELEAYYPAIPASVCNLHYLQTLEAQIKLSGEIGDLINLRHLRGYDQQDPLPREVAGLTNLQALPCITLGVGDEWFKLKDLKGLPNLRDSYLEVRGLRNVAWPDVDTPPEAYLKDKRGIKELELYWGHNIWGEEELVGDVDERLAARVLDSLQPHCDLERMWIYGYPGAVLPTWLAHELPVLRDLWIVGMPRVKSLVLPATKKMEKKSEQSHGLELCRDTEDGAESRRWFPSLESLRLEKMNGLEEWQQQGADDPELGTLPSLSNLHELWIRDCPELRKLPSLPSLTKLSLEHEFSPELLSAAGGCCCGLPMLRDLVIWQYSGENLIFPPNDGSLDPLEGLTIYNCSELRSVEGLGGLPSLRRLHISMCPLLRRLPSLPSLTRLGLMDEFSRELLNGGCCCLPMLQCLDICSYRGDSLIFPNDRSLDSLEELTIYNCYELRSVEGLGGLPSLRHLEIHHCPVLRRLPSLPWLTKLELDSSEFSPELLLSGCGLPMLRSLHIACYSGDSLIIPNDGSLDPPLEKLSISYCRELRSVEGLGGLPSLRHLKIDHCPLLQMSPHQRPPPSLQDVKISDSPGAQEWYHSTNKSDL